MTETGAMTMTEGRPARPAVFLDRDGTICEEMGYVNHVDRLRIFPFAAEAIRRLTARFNEQVELFSSMMRTESALAFYISSNIDTVRRNNLLAEHAKWRR